jgi:LL-diaminopimelate aminotransferase
MKFSALSVTALALLAPAANAFAFAPSPSSSTHVARSTELYSEVDRNANFAKLEGGYLFPEIGRRRNAYMEENPEMASRIISLGIGDTTLPIPPHILNGLLEGVKKLAVKETYIGMYNCTQLN